MLLTCHLNLEQNSISVDVHPPVGKATGQTKQASKHQFPCLLYFVNAMDHICLIILEQVTDSIVMIPEISFISYVLDAVMLISDN